MKRKLAELSESESEEEGLRPLDPEVKEEVKPKKPRTQKQIDALNKGRAKALANREINKKLRKQEFDENVEKVIKQSIKEKTPPVEKIVEKHYYHAEEPKRKKQKVVKEESSDDDDEVEKPIKSKAKRKVVKQVESEEEEQEQIQKKKKRPEPISIPKPRLEIQFV